MPSMILLVLKIQASLNSVQLLELVEDLNLEFKGIKKGQITEESYRFFFLTQL